MTRLSFLLLGPLLRPLLGLVLGLLGCLCGLGLGGCQRDLGPPLVEVTQVSPRDLEQGDRMELRGSGFPQGRVAHVTFRGTLVRPGEGPSSGVTLETEGTVATSDRIDVAVTEALEESFCGHGDRAAHATFTGQIEVAFASSAPGAPPLVGTMYGATLDVRPSSVRAAVAEARAADGARLLRFLGIVPGAASGRGLSVESVAPGSPASLVGILPGDVLAAIDGVHVAEIGDLLPASARVTALQIRRGESTEETRTIALVGFAGGAIPSEYASALVVVGLALAVLLLLIWPGPPSLGGLEQRAASHLRATSLAAMAREVFGQGPRVFASVLASVLVGTFALGPYVVDADVDGALLLVAAVALLAASRIAASRGFTASGRAGLGVAASGGLLAASLAGMVMLEGALQLGELVRGQGGAPWELAALRRPAAAVLGLAYVGTLFVVTRTKVERPSASVEILDRLGVFFASALGVAVFFGGWQLPGAAGSHSLAIHLLAGLVFVAKTWALVSVLRGSAVVAPPWAAGDARAFAQKRLLPVLAVGAALVLLSRRITPGATFEAAWGMTVAVALALVAMRSALRVKGAMDRPEPHVSPFL